MQQAIKTYAIGQMMYIPGYGDVRILHIPVNPSQAWIFEVPETQSRFAIHTYSAIWKIHEQHNPVPKNEPKNQQTDQANGNGTQVEPVDKSS